MIEDPFIEFFSNAEITISHDLDAACFAMYNDKPNITCILGTGSNSCLYDGENIIENAPSLGFIVGDEASGNYFGKKILSLYFNNIMSDELKEKLEDKFETDISIINKNIYNNNRANVFLSKYFPFIIETKNYPIIQELIKDTLDEFINLHVKCFRHYQEVEINFIGSVSFFLFDEIHDAAKRNNFKVGKIMQNPIKKLIDFHFDKIKQNQKKQSSLS
ncbi:MAG: ATPase [Flavobacteriales bacterium]